jgi:hypothetical protein
MNRTAAVTSIIVGVILSGQCAIWGACLGGHDPKAGYPFPDLKGAVLFLIGLSVVPLVVVVCTAVVRRFLSTRLITVRLPISLAILTLAPLFSLGLGYLVQSSDNRERDRRHEFDAKQKEAYFHYAKEVTSDPGIVLRERWYEKVPETLWSDAGRSSRRMVFEHSFNSDHLAVAYTGDQLREISRRAEDKSLFVVCHPKCPPDLIEALWPEVYASGQAWMIDRMVDNPATPRHLLEKHQAERLSSKRAVAR